MSVNAHPENNAVRALLDAGADINGQLTFSDGTTGDTALVEACFCGHAAMADALLADLFSPVSNWEVPGTSDFKCPF